MQQVPGSDLNVSLVESQQRPPVGLILRHYGVSVALYGSLLALLVLNPWFKGLLSVSVNGVTPLQLYCQLYAFYVVTALPLLLLVRPRSLWGSKNLLVFAVVVRWARAMWRRIRSLDAPAVTMSHKEKHALEFLLIKLFFGPLMLSSVFIEIGWCQRFFRQLHPPSLVAKLDFGYIVFVHSVFLADSSLYLIGYHTEAGFLRNQIRYVETNLWRILVCLVCYPPFSQATVSLLGPSFNDPYILVFGDFRGGWTWALRTITVASLCLLMASSLSLFTKASNLTNRGIVSWGPYRFIRHPAYFANIVFWLTTIVPSLIPNPSNVYFSWPSYWMSGAWAVCGFFGWAMIYFLRAVTEEQFLSRDPDYVAYCEKVKFRFIPGLY